MSAKSVVVSIWNGLNHLSTVVWLIGLTGGSVSAAKVASVMPGGWAQNPFLPLSWFFGTLALVLTGGKAIEWMWRRAIPPKLDVVLHGGDSVSITVSPSVTDEYYGFAWFTDEWADRRRPFELHWEGGYRDKRKIRAKDKSSVLLARRTGKDRTDLRLDVLGDGRVVRTWDLGPSVKRVPSNDGYFDGDLEWIGMRVELRGRTIPHIWTHEFRFRLNRFVEFEVEKTTQLASRTAEQIPS
jgi:hypothetical protein